ncbi:MAG: DUF7689 domain-containing protein [Gemmataceae bacterium]
MPHVVQVVAAIAEDKVVLLQRSDSLLLQTRAKWRIPNELRPERHPAALKAAVELAHALVPDAILRSITATYNCVGMVVACRRTWVDPADLVRVLREDGYRKLKGPEESDVGDVVIYHDDNGEPCHVGLVLRKNLLLAGGQEDLLTVLSKWGADGEYIHGASRVPVFLGTPAEYWTDRRTL